jgi:tRNA A-37 threonylcarbamoyl transferase component Bud32
VFDRGDGTVLRRYRTREVPAREIDVMRYAHAGGYPVPEVIAASGNELVLTRVIGPTMQEALSTRTTSIAEAARQLAELHHKLHDITGPGWLPMHADGDRLLHLDLHPRNVLLGPAGPVVIDWANAARGPAALDPALALAVFASVRANVSAQERVHMNAFMRAFASHFDAAAIEIAFPLAFELRAADPNVSDRERDALRAFRLSDLHSA